MVSSNLQGYHSFGQKLAPADMETRSAVFGSKQDHGVLSLSGWVEKLEARTIAMGNTDVDFKKDRVGNVVTYPLG